MTFGTRSESKSFRVQMWIVSRAPVGQHTDIAFHISAESAIMDVTVDYSRAGFPEAPRSKYNPRRLHQWHATASRIKLTWLIRCSRRGVDSPKQHSSHSNKMQLAKRLQMTSCHSCTCGENALVLLLSYETAAGLKLPPCKPGT
jgi:hypothetical protein